MRSKKVFMKCVSYLSFWCAFQFAEYFHYFSWLISFSTHASLEGEFLSVCQRMMSSPKYNYYSDWFDIIWLNICRPHKLLYLRSPVIFVLEYVSPFSRYKLKFLEREKFMRGWSISLESGVVWAQNHKHFDVTAWTKTVWNPTGRV